MRACADRESCARRHLTVEHRTILGRRGSGSLGQHHEVVAVDDLVGDALGQVGRAPAGDLTQSHGVEPHQALGEDRTV